MVFSSLIFLCIFLPVVYILHLIIPSIRWKNGLLIVTSLLFYAYGEPVYVLLMILSTLINYFGARALSGKMRNAVLAIVVIVNLGMLGVFKYTGFILNTLNDMCGLNIPVPNIVLPIGISFFTFQALSYVIDVYRGNVGVQKNYFKVLLYISFFPQLIAGPIVKYRDIELEINDRTVTAQESAFGLQRFIFGLSKKVLIANTMGLTADRIFGAGNDSLNILSAWIGAFAYMLQIYYDFSGYSDMAIGLGRMFGFHFKENFLHPYGAVSIQDFWRKWHVSLSGWFKEYLYIPLGGNRKGRLRTCLNKIIVFFCTGLWHGANWTFVVWGLFHGAFLLLEDFIPVLRKLPKVLSHIYVIVVVMVGFVLFRADTIAQGGYFISQMFTGFSMDGAAVSLAVQQLTPWFITMLIAGIIFMAPIQKFTDRLTVFLEEDTEAAEGAEQQPEASLRKAAARLIISIICVLLLIWCMVRLSSGTYNPFIYFRF
ncbi:MAG TPA: MBOAT family protein [Candidatus Mediterraneibacter pullistercoris]|nr:MBOAT family protein [Candidatus Mediterraneibacter pullistercoris]